MGAWGRAAPIPQILRRYLNYLYMTADNDSFSCF